MNEKVSSRQVILLITISMLTTIITLMSILSVSPRNQDIWISIALSIVYIIVLNIPILYFANKYNHLNMFQWIERILGKSIGKFIIFLYGLFFISIVLIYLSTTIQMIRNSFLPQTKPALLILFLVSICIFINIKGLSTLMKTSEFFVPIIITTLLFFILLGSNQIELTSILPIYRDSTFLEINLGAIQTSLIFNDIFILAIIAPKLENTKDINKIYIKSSVYSLVLIIIVCIATIAALGLEQSKHLNFPFLTYIRSILSYSIFERIEPFYIIVWLISMVIRIAAYFYITIESIKVTFNKKGNKVIYVLGVLLFLITNYLTDINSILRELGETTYGEYLYYMFFKIVIPMIIVLVYLFRRKNLEKIKNKLY